MAELKLEITLCYLFIIPLLSNVTLIIGQTLSPAFHRTFSEECLLAGISSPTDCSRKNNRISWSPLRRTAESDKKYSPKTGLVGKSSKKCFSKISVYTQFCQSVPECQMTVYKYHLPKPRNGQRFEIANCANDWEFQSPCKANGPGGKNITVTNFHCFSKGIRSYCGVRYEKCESKKFCFSWTNYKRNCYSECTADRAAINFVRNCKECDGGEVDTSYCPGGIKNSSKSGRCIKKGRIKRLLECNKPVTTTITKTDGSQKPGDSATTGKTSNVVTITGPTSFTTKNQGQTQLVTTSTTLATTTVKPTTKSTTTPKEKTTEKTKTNSAFKTTATSISPFVSVKQTTGRKEVDLNVFKVDKRILTPHVKSSQTTNNNYPDMMKLSIREGNRDDDDLLQYDIATWAGAGGAGLLSVVLLVLLIVVFTKRREARRQALSLEYKPSTSSLYRNRNRKNPVVNSSSFRLSTWIRERPALSNIIVEPSDQEEIHADYWTIGDRRGKTGSVISSDSIASELQPELRRVLKNSNKIQKRPVTNCVSEPVYDRIDSDEAKDEAYATIGPMQRIRNISGYQPSITSNCSRPSLNYRSSISPTSENNQPIYAVVRKSRKTKNASSKKVMRRGNSEGNFAVVKTRKPKKKSNRSSTLNGQHLRDGVLQIEFDEVEGLRCKLSDSNVYINFEETDTAPVM